MEHDVTFDNIADYFISTSNATGSLITNLSTPKARLLLPGVVPRLGRQAPRPRARGGVGQRTRGAGSVCAASG